MVQDNSVHIFVYIILQGAFFKEEQLFFMDSDSISQISDNIPGIIVLVILVMLSSYFSATETAFFSMNKIRMKSMANEGNRRAAKALKISEDTDGLLSTLLIGNNLVNIATTAIATVMFIDLLGEDIGPTISTIVVTIIVLLFGEITPKSVAKNMPEAFSMFSAPYIAVLMVVFKPVNWIVSSWQRLIYKVIKAPQDRGVTEEELITMVEEAHNDGEIDSNESALIRNAIEFNEKEVEEIYTSRVDVVAIDVDSTLDEIQEAFSKGYSRLPVYMDTVDNIIGILNQKDFEMMKSTGQSIKSVMSDPIFIVPSMKISELLKVLQSKKSHMAIILDEYGGTVGIATLEDVLEELVGEIWDEHDVVVEPFVKIADNKYKVRCSADLDDMFHLFDMKDETDIPNVGAWVVEEFGKLPRIGDTFDYGPLHVCVSKRDPRRVTEIIVSKSEPAAEDAEDDKDE